MPKTARPIWERTVGVPVTKGTAWVSWAKIETARNITPRIEAMRTSVDRALRTWGSLEHGDRVGDGLHSGHCRAAVGEGPQEDEQRGAEQQPPRRRPHRDVSRRVSAQWCEVSRDGRRTTPANTSAAMAAKNQYVGNGEDPPGLPDAPEVPVGEEQHAGTATRHG